MPLLTLIALAGGALAWGAVTTVVVAACQVTSVTDRRSAQARKSPDVDERMAAAS
jgi:hypothetical protein